jgi:hypothetical protein
MRYCDSLESLITKARLQSNNSDYSSSQGNPQSLFEMYANEAQDNLQTQIINNYPQEFVEFYEKAITTHTEFVTVPDDIFSNNRIISVEYSHTGDSKDYFPLNPRTVKERLSNQSSYPSFYIRISDKIYLNPIPSTGKVRIAYYRELDDIKVPTTTVFGTPSGSTITSASNIGLQEYLCVSNRFGEVLLRGAKIANVSGTTITVFGNVADYLVSGVTLANLAGQNITIGKYTTTHSKLPKICERYLITYMAKRALAKDSSSQAGIEDGELARMEAQILESFAQPTEDVYTIPILDRGILRG